MIIQSYISVGDLNFSDTRDQIREKIACPYEVGVKEINDIIEFYDYFVGEGIIVIYDSNDIVQAFEFFEPHPIFEGVNLLGTQSTDLIKYFEQLDKDIVIEYDGLKSYKFGVGIYDPNGPDEPDSYPYSVIVFKKGYYDS